jgi:hypothetical protein
VINTIDRWDPALCAEPHLRLLACILDGLRVRLRDDVLGT